MKLDFSFVPFPREVWTENIPLTQAEFRLLGWLCCNLKFGMDQPEITDAQVLVGFRTDEGYTYPPSGLSSNSLRRAREGLVAKKLVLSERVFDGGGRGREAVWSYVLNIPKLGRFTAKPSQLGQQTLPTWTLNPPNLDAHKGIESTERTEEHKPSSDGVLDIPKLFAYFREQAGKSESYTLSPKRKIMAERRWVEALRIAKGDIDAAKLLIKNAIDALCDSKFHRENGFLEWDQVFRSEDNFTKWIDRWENPKP